MNENLGNIHKINIEEFQTLIGLVEHYSPTGNVQHASEWLIQRFNTLGYARAFVDPYGNTIGILGEGPKQIIFLGHLDTVPGEIPVRIENDYLFGRGCVDAKGALACFVDSVNKIGVVPGWQFLIIATNDEEGESKGAFSLIKNYQPDFLIVGEPNHWDRIGLGYKGSLVLQIRFTQRKSHSARDDLSIFTQCMTMWDLLNIWVEKQNHLKEKLFEKLQMTIVDWSSGSNGFEDWAAIQIAFRLPIGFIPSNITTFIQDNFPKADICRIGNEINAYLCDKNTNLVRAFLHSIRSNAGVPGFILKTGTSDLNIVAPYWNCPAVVYGPGDSSLDHTPEEALALSEYKKAVEVLVSALKYLVNQKPIEKF